MTEADRSPAEDDLDSFVRRTDPDRWLSSRFALTAEARADLITLWALDGELGRIPNAVSDPLIGEIRLTWWREALAEMAAGAPPRGHPVLAALAQTARRTGLDLAALDPIIDLHLRRLDPAPFPDVEAVDAWLDAAAAVSTAAVRVLDLDADPQAAAAAARTWTLARAELDGCVAFDPKALDALHADLRAQARSDVRRLSAKAFPAAAHAALARTRTDRPGELQARLRLVLAVARGRI